MENRDPMNGLGNLQPEAGGRQVRRQGPHSRASALMWKTGTTVRSRKTGPRTARDRVRMKRTISETDRRKDVHTEGKAAAGEAGRKPGGEQASRKPGERV